MENIVSFINTLRPVFERFVRKTEPLDTWLPPDDDPDTSWYKAQGFPGSGDKPDLLLHNLGSFEQNPGLRKRVHKIFPRDPRAHTFLVNTSGSGKTRLMLEGLCLRWGFYFASVVDSNGLGSSDIYNAIVSIVPNSPGFLKELPSRQAGGELTAHMLALSQNRVIAGKRFAEILLARIIILQLFIEVVQACTNVTEPKKLWLLIQLFPMKLGFAGGDFFVGLTNILFNSPMDWTQEQGLQRFETINEFFSPPGTTVPFFIVLDEAQYAARSHFSAFRSDADLSASRPILREIVRAWVMDLFNTLRFWLVISGTGIDRDVIIKVLASGVSKPDAHRLCVLNNVGAFTNYAEHFAFMERYIPPRIFGTPSGKALTERMSYWLHGRYRFTTAFLSELICQRFRSPHRLFNAFVETFAGITPTEGQQWVTQEHAEDPSWPGPGDLQLNSFDFEKLAKYPEMVSKIAKIVNVALIREGLTTDVTVTEKRFVEYGIARHAESTTKNNSIVIDEPLVLAAFAASSSGIANSSTSYLAAIAQSSPSYYSNQISSNTTHSNGLEDYLAFTLPVLFEKKPRLNQVFDFYGSIPSWSAHEAELVSVYSGWPTPDISPVLPNARPSFSYGFDAGPDHATTVKWLQHRKAGTFILICQNRDGMGPDLIFVLRVLDGSSPAPLLWVALQAKYGEGSSPLKVATLRHAIRSVTPSRFWINKNGDQHAPVANPQLVTKTLRVLKDLPHRMTPTAGTYSLLRVVAACPVSAAMGRVAGLKSRGDYQDVGKHPLASLNMRFLATVTHHLPPTGKLASMLEDDPSDMDLDAESDPGSDPESELGLEPPDTDDLVGSTSKHGIESDSAGSDAEPPLKKTNTGKGRSKAKGKGKAKGKPGASVKSVQSKRHGRGDISMSAASRSVPASNADSSNAMSVSAPPSASSGVGTNIWTADTYSVRSLRNRSKEY
ncbi:hypothetical protein B0H11DRAFT_1738165 [Mycena galericulata]|nr:hypothetical protein B0H11DRAFT_1738165 [Mycena galericulata]